MDQLAKVNSLQWHRYMLWKEKDEVICKILKFEVRNHMKKSLKKSKKQVEEELLKVGLKRQSGWLIKVE